MFVSAENTNKRITWNGSLMNQEQVQSVIKTSPSEDEKMSFPEERCWPISSLAWLPGRQMLPPPSGQSNPEQGFTERTKTTH